MDRPPLWKVFVEECRDFFLDCIRPLILLARWIRRRHK
ncbi:hypothetical protein LMG28614_05188 [Paraburkholderia ultramafica]|uniref:Uncharacterized protein n=1 Tax=Paraburkholderia ultramafica TaxID=1544867 RepID=A0A6S7BVI7_9BURK|nr:hypothetical protein LMG28614_05188 [Paraburkholderia ultramafica]